MAISGFVDETQDGMQSSQSCLTDVWLHVHLNVKPKINVGPNNQQYASITVGPL